MRLSLLAGGFAVAALALVAEPSVAPTLDRLVAVHGRNFAESRPTLRASGAHLVSRRLGLWRVPPSSAPLIVRSLAARGWLRAQEPDRPVQQLVTLPGGDPLAVRGSWMSRVGAQGLQPPARGVPVTVVDSGLDASHPEFAGRSDTVALNDQTLIGPRAFHGTAVSSVIAAPENGLGFVGLYPAAELWTWDASPDASLSASEVVAGIEAAAARGPGVINLSLGGSRSRFEQEAIDVAFERGSIVVAASGNGRRSGSSESYPASLPHVLTVGSVDRTNRVSSFSSRSSGMDVAAPGEDILVAVPTTFDPSGFQLAQGTSFAAPMVAAATAWVWTARPKLHNTQLFELMRRSARDLGPKGRDQDTGFGRLDIRAALRLPAPAVDPGEPNDSPGAVRGRQPVAPGLTARLDITDDPRDYYPVSVPAQSRLTVTVSASERIPFQLVDRGGGVTIRRVRGPGRRWLLENTRTEPVVVVVKLYLPLDARSTHATYRLSLRG